MKGAGGEARRVPQACVGVSRKAILVPGPADARPVATATQSELAAIAAKEWSPKSTVSPTWSSAATSPPTRGWSRQLGRGSVCPGLLSPVLPKMSF